MRERVDKIVDYGSEDIGVSTFHRPALHFKTPDIDRLGYDKNFTIYEYGIN